MTAEIAAKDGDIPSSIGADFPVRGKPYRDLDPDEWSQVRSITFERHFSLLESIFAIATIVAFTVM